MGHVHQQDPCVSLESGDSAEREVGVSNHLSIHCKHNVTEVYLCYWGKDLIAGTVLFVMIVPRSSEVSQ